LFGWGGNGYIDVNDVFYVLCGRKTTAFLPVIKVSYFFKQKRKIAEI
jgi:hypothetical protein